MGKYLARVMYTALPWFSVGLCARGCRGHMINHLLLLLRLYNSKIKSRYSDFFTFFYD